MLRISALLGTVVVLIGLAFSPTTIGADLRRAGAISLVRSGMPAGGVLLLRPLAAAGDAVAQNDLGVLVHAGKGVAADQVEAARLLNAASTAGLKRAELNLVLIRNPCEGSVAANEAKQKLTVLARGGDQRAAAFLGDCLSYGTSQDTHDSLPQLLEAAKIATTGNDPYEEMKFGYLFLEELRLFAERNGTRRAVMTALPDDAVDYLLRAAEHCQAAGYAGLAVVADKYTALLSPPAAAKARARSKDGWLEAAAVAGHPKSGCTYGVILARKIVAAGAPDKADRELYNKLFMGCFTHRNSPRKIVNIDGVMRPLGYSPIFDVRMRDDAFLVATPRYRDYDYSEAEQDIALSAMVKIAEAIRARDLAARPKS